MRAFSFCHFACVSAGLLISTLASSPTWAGTRAIDGDASDWVGTPSATVHAAVVSAGEWIYTGQAGDSRTDPTGDDANYDLTEVRFTRDDLWLYGLVRYADITNTNEIHLAIGFELDNNPADSDGMNFFGHQSGTGFASASDHPEYQLSIHNTPSPVTQIERFRNGESTWTAPPTPGWSVWISEPNNLVEFRIALADLELTTTTSMRVMLVTFDNGTTSDPGGLAWNNSEDTTVDYITTDALDVMTVGATPGDSSWDRDLSNGQIDVLNAVDLAVLPVELSAFGLE